MPPPPLQGAHREPRPPAVPLPSCTLGCSPACIPDLAGLLRHPFLSCHPDPVSLPPGQKPTSTHRRKSQEWPLLGQPGPWAQFIPAVLGETSVPICRLGNPGSGALGSMDYEATSRNFRDWVPQPCPRRHVVGRGHSAHFISGSGMESPSPSLQTCHSTREKPGDLGAPPGPWQEETMAGWAGGLVSLWWLCG